jgi:hypothetical protein
LGAHEPQNQTPTVFRQHRDALHPEPQSLKHMLYVLSNLHPTPTVLSTP